MYWSMLLFQVGWKEYGRPRWGRNTAFTYYLPVLPSLGRVQRWREVARN